MTDIPAPPPPEALLAPPPAAAEPVPAQAPAPAHPFSFSGNAREYFGIWIVNLFLTIATLGIYSAWAKVRKKRYFYGNAWVAGSNFEYHGDPIAILKGRIIAVTAFVIYTWVGSFAPRSAALILLALMPAIPWLLLRSFAFNAVNSSYRNIRFHFAGRYAEVAKAIAPFVLIPVATLIAPEFDPAEPPRELPWQYMALFIAPAIFLAFYPYVVGRLKLIHANGARFGAAPFACTARIRQFYLIYVVAGLIAGVLIVAFMFGMMTALVMGPAGFVAAPLMYVVLGAIFFGYTRSRVANLMFNTTRLEGGVRLESTLSARKLAWLYATNVVASLVTLGLAIPWAAVRVARYRATCLTLRAESGLEGFIAHAGHAVGATGEEMGEMFDVDLSL